MSLLSWYYCRLSHTLALLLFLTHIFSLSLSLSLLLFLSLTLSYSLSYSFSLSTCRRDTRFNHCRIHTKSEGGKTKYYLIDHMCFDSIYDLICYYKVCRAALVAPVNL